MGTKSEWVKEYLSFEGSCWGLVVAVYRKELNIDLPEFDGKDVKFEANGFSMIGLPQEFDIVYFEDFPFRSHVGIALMPNQRMLHACNSVVSAIAYTPRSVCRYYRHESK